MVRSCCSLATLASRTTARTCEQDRYGAYLLAHGARVLRAQGAQCTVRYERLR